ncbi:hypothetical protein SAMN06264849_11418 [Melghirimyces algeriensis]|uniref:Uncharacterized protein n=1 Tax=Melghirimyces algeriensis TaxID=910412 RepID=A0A521F7J2_9BACL|nr:hypothetical protein SAMN06264849_11418 [Melghirimyces algeriensis]
MRRKWTFGNRVLEFEHEEETQQKAQAWLVKGEDE